jgi:peroxiredoxin
LAKFALGTRLPTSTARQSSQEPSEVCTCHQILSKVTQICAEVSLSTFLQPSTPSSSPDSDAPWLLLLFIPAAFSFVCPTEVVAFQNCYDEFRDRNCKIAFIPVDTKHSLWHWQNVPRQYGGLGNTDIPLLSDATPHVRERTRLSHFPRVRGPHLKLQHRRSAHAPSRAAGRGQPSSTAPTAAISYPKHPQEECATCTAAQPRD